MRDDVAKVPCAPVTADGILPPRILSNKPGTWAHDTVNRRLRESILARVFEDNAATLDTDPTALSALEALDAELADAARAVLRPIEPDGGPDVRAWNDVILPPWIGATWLDAPWLVSEFYFYRRILEALGYFAPGRPGALVDPFQRDKDAGLGACADATYALAQRLNAFTTDMKRSVDDMEAADANATEALRLFLLVSLWGNRMDLSLWPAGGVSANPASISASSARAADAFEEALSAGARSLLWDDSLDAAKALLRARRVGVVVDNAGYELVCDLALADAVVCAASRLGSDGDKDDAESDRVRVTLRVKSHPTFVSDAMGKDVVATVDALAGSSDPATAAMGARWRAHLSIGAWTIEPSFAWCQPQPLWELPREACEALERDDLVVLKGDANYRRLLGDRLWPLDAPFHEVAAYFPAPLLALRTLKAELGCGIPRERAEKAEAERPGTWMTDGVFGVAQFLPNPTLRREA